MNYIGDTWDLSLNNTRFGEVTVTAPASGTDQELAAKITTDLGLGYKLTDRITFNANINNIFDVYPDVTKASTGTSQAGSRFMYSSEVQQLGQLGTNYTGGYQLPVLSTIISLLYSTKEQLKSCSFIFLKKWLLPRISIFSFVALTSMPIFVCIRNYIC